MKGRVLICAGSDSGGGAGIQADIKTVTALGGYAATAITALTAQNTRGVFGVLGVAPDFVRQQMTLVLDDIGAEAIKTGMLADSTTIGAVVAILKSHGGGRPIVVDPVMVAQSGDSLLEASAVASLRAELLPLASVITPNLPEAETLLGRTIDGPRSMEAAARDLLATGASAVLLKGGHAVGETVIDVLAWPGGLERFESPRIPSGNNHGTGCTLASAVAAGLAQDLSLRDAVERARAYVQAAIRQAPGYGAGNGPLDHMAGARRAAGPAGGSGWPGPASRRRRHEERGTSAGRSLPLYQVDAFASDRFAGNPAAVCPLEDWLPDTLLQSIALENNLSETAFFVRENGRYRLRWFTPAREVDLCGHATLASAYVIATHLDPEVSEIRFHSPHSGDLSVRRDGELFTLDFPARPAQPVPEPAAEIEALGLEPREVWRASKGMAVLRDQAEVLAATPDLDKVAALPGDGLIITAPGEDCDFVSRYFAPASGIDEDPVTGSAHCTLTPYWARRLGKTRMTARQVSKRGGELLVEDRGERIFISGRVAPYLEGRILV